MARLLDNAWCMGYSNDDFHRNNAGYTEITPAITAQSTHSAFTISGNHITWSQQGRYRIEMRSLPFDGDDNEEGYGAFAFDSGVTGATTQDFSNKMMGPPYWNPTNQAGYPDKTGIVTGHYEGLNADSAAVTVTLKFLTATITNTTQTGNPAFWWSIQHH